MNVEIIKDITSEDWMLVKTLALSTCDMKAKTEPTFEWKQKILVARHSPIRELKFIFKLEVPYWVSVHLCRHVHAQPYVKSQRNDRQKIDNPDYDRNKAPQDTMVTMYWSVNAEELITIAHKRLCMLASKETRLIVQEICNQVCDKHPEFKCVLVKPCVYNGCCHEMKPCGYTDIVYKVL